MLNVLPIDNRQKSCHKCGEVKFLHEFRKASRGQESHEKKCMQCTKPEPKEKKCLGCGEVFPVDVFRRKNNTRHLKSRCLPCTQKQKKSVLTSEQRKKHTLKNSYGITLNHYNDMLERQSGRCLICDCKFDMSYKPKGGSGAKSPCVDHCHTTGKIRGLLCSNCNKGIGCLKENISILSRAIQYIANHSEVASHEH